jgi:hypothetical protein
MQNINRPQYFSKGAVEITIIIGGREALKQSLICILSKISCLWMGIKVTLYVGCGKD